MGFFDHGCANRGTARRNHDITWENLKAVDIPPIGGQGREFVGPFKLLIYIPYRDEPKLFDAAGLAQSPGVKSG
jgi:hypothetical protein